MGVNRRSFTREFKQQSVELIESGKVSVGGLSRDLDIDPKTLRRWKREFGTERSTARDVGARDASAIALQKENEQLRRENEKLRRERELLKKVLRIVSDE